MGVRALRRELSERCVLSEQTILACDVSLSGSESDWQRLTGLTESGSQGDERQGSSRAQGVARWNSY